MTFNLDFSVDQLRLRTVELRRNGELLPLSSSDIISAVEAFLLGNITKEELSEWADFYDGNDDVVFEEGYPISDIIFDLANPEINDWIDADRALKYLATLRSGE